MAENTPPGDRPSSPPPEDPAFKAPEALIWGVFLGAAGVALAALVLSGADIWTMAYWGSDDRSAVLRNLGLLVIAVPALYLAWKRTTTASRQADTANKQQRVAERGLNIDRYQKGAQMLESKELSVRIAGIFGLRELAMSDPEESYILVQSLLFAFVREKSKERNELFWRDEKQRFVTYTEQMANPSGAQPPTPKPDIIEALKACTDLRNKFNNSREIEEKAKWRPDLIGVYLAGASLFGTNLSGADLEDADLCGAELWTVDLSGARLIGAKLSGADFSGAILSRARFWRADLSYAYLFNADLSGAELASANLSGAYLGQVEISESTKLKGIWAWADRPPHNMPPEIEAVIELRDPAEREEGD